MRWEGLRAEADGGGTLPGLDARIPGLLRTVSTPEFAGVRFHEVTARSALNRVPKASAMPFTWTINPFRGCSHSCVYCLAGGTLVLMADGSQRPLAELRVGDRIVGTERQGGHRRYVATRVLAHWSTVKPAHRVRLADGTTLVASAEHRFLGRGGWRQASRLAAEDQLLGVGRTASPPEDDAGYRRGYLAGLVRGADALDDERFRLAAVAMQALERAQAYLDELGLKTVRVEVPPRTPDGVPGAALRSSSARTVRRLRGLVAWPERPGASWRCGFLAGLVDAGSDGDGLRIVVGDAELHARAEEALRALGFRAGPGPGVLRLSGGPRETLRFLQLTEPAVRRECVLTGTAVEDPRSLRVTGVEALGVSLPMYDITTGTGDFVANGVISHNCFARGTHRYLDLDTGAGFDQEIVVKVNLVERLRVELARPSWQREHVALGTNTDPYQRAEGRYRLMPGVIDALTSSGTPFSVLTKGTLMRRDLPALARAARDVPVGLGVSVAIWDQALHRSLEPGAPGPRGRLDLVRAIRDAGLPCGVFLAPVLPWLTDSMEHLDAALATVAAAGATGVTVFPLHLRPGAREWFFTWLERERPDLVPGYRRLYRRGANAPPEYKRWLARRAAPLVRRHGLDGSSGAALRSGRVDPAAADGFDPAAPDAEGRGWPAGSLPPGVRAVAEPDPEQLMLL